MNEMQKRKLPVVILLTISIILLLSVGTFAYIYFNTNIFKSNKEIFLNYASQMFSEDDGFIDSKIIDLNTKKQSNIYANSAEISFDLNSLFEDDKQTQEILNNMTISADGIIDNINMNFNESIDINYSDDVSFPINISNTDNIFGIQTDYIGSNYISIDSTYDYETDDFEIISSILSLKSVIDSISQSNLTFTTEELLTLKSTYIAIIEKYLVEEDFSVIDDNGLLAYSLNISEETLYNMTYEILYTAKTDTIILDKIELILNTNYQIDDYTNYIDTLLEEIENVKENIVDAENNLIITLDIVNEKATSFNISDEYNEFNILVTKITTTDGIDYNTSITTNINENEVLEVNLLIGYTGLLELSNITEKYEIEFNYIDNENEDDDAFLGYYYKNKIRFDTETEIEVLTEENSLILNEYSKDEIDNLFTAIVDRIIAINEIQMEDLGFSETSNPLLLINPTIYLPIDTIISSASYIENEETIEFNERFSNYIGTNVESSDINLLLMAVHQNNISYSGDSSKQIYLEVNCNLGTSWIDSIPENDEYSISFSTSGSPVTDLIYTVEMEYDKDTRIY